MELEGVFRSLVRVQIDLWDALDRALRVQQELPLVRYLPMRVIAETPSCRVQDVAVALRITTGGATQAVDRIAADGLVTRRPNPSDRRSSILELTAEGTALLERAAGTVDAQLHERLGPLPDAVVDGLRRGLDELDPTRAPAA